MKTIFQKSGHCCPSIKLVLGCTVPFLVFTQFLHSFLLFQYIFLSTHSLPSFFFGSFPSSFLDPSESIPSFIHKRLPVASISFYLVPFHYFPICFHKFVSSTYHCAFPLQTGWCFWALNPKTKFASANNYILLLEKSCQKRLWYWS